MYKIITIAMREYRAMVATKAFLISLIMMPVLMMGSLWAVELLKSAGSVEDRQISVLDPGKLYFDDLLAKAKERNDFVESQIKSGENNREEDGLPQMASGEILKFELYELDENQRISDDLRADLSELVRKGDLYAFIEMPSMDGSGRQKAADIMFYGQDSSLSGTRSWLEQTLNEIIKVRRLQKANIDPNLVAAASQIVPVRAMGLLKRDSSGNVIPAREENEMLKIFLPFGAMMFMFMVIFMSSQPMLESVIEEKSQRIAEVLLGSASPFQLMMGKLIGTVGGSLTVFCIYLVGVLVLAQRVPFLNDVPAWLIPWFIIFQILGVLFYASIFMAVGASVSQLKEAQSMLMPVWMLMMSPMFVWLLILREPRGGLAVGMSMFPPATPTTMVMRLATGVPVPIWELVLGMVLLALATLVVVVLAGRIFRAGILWQGKTPKISEIIRWAISG